MDIVYCVDQSYFKPAVISAISLLSNLKDTNKKVSIHIIHDGLSDDLYAVQSFLSNQYNNVEIKFHRINKAHVPFRLGANHLRRERIDATSIFYRLFISELFPDLKKALYLDADTIINGDIEELWNIDLQEFSIGAVAESYCGVPSLSLTKLQHMVKIGMNSVYYFNSGVLLMNLKKLREQHFLNTCIDFYSKKKQQLLWAEQDMLNSVLEGKVLFLPPKFNHTIDILPIECSPFKFFIDYGKQCPYTIRQIREAYNYPYIIHYCGPIKPWSFPGKYYTYKEKYWHFYNCSPWKNEDSTVIEEVLNKVKKKRNFVALIAMILNVRLYKYLFLETVNHGLSFKDVCRSFILAHARANLKFFKSYRLQ